MDRKTKQMGIACGALSGLTYGIYTTLVLVAGGCDPLAGSLGLLAAPYVCAGLNDLLSGLWLTVYHARKGRLGQLGRVLGTVPGRRMLLGALLGGPVANGAYLVGLALAGAYAIPVSATCGLFGALFAWLFLGQRPGKRVVLGMLTCAAGAVILNWVPPADSPNFALGILCALLAAVCWGLEGMFSGSGGGQVDTDAATNLRQLLSGTLDLVIVVPVIGAAGLLKGTLSAGWPVLLLALSGLAAGASYLLWYRANSTVGCAIGMSLNVTYAFWGVLLSILFLGQPVTATIVLGSCTILLGAVLVTMNPLELLRRPAPLPES